MVLLGQLVLILILMNGASMKQKMLKLLVTFILSRALVVRIVAVELL